MFYDWCSTNPYWLHSLSLSLFLIGWWLMARFRAFTIFALSSPLSLERGWLRMVARRGVLIDLRIYSGQITTRRRRMKEHVAKNGVWGTTRVSSGFGLIWFNSRDVMTQVTLSDSFTSTWHKLTWENSSEVELKFYVTQIKQSDSSWANWKPKEQ